MASITPIGKIIPKRSLDIKSSRLGIGFEKLDRDVFDPEKAYDKLALVGVKWVRLQSGWQRTEREKGVYNFAWLDRVVDELIARGMRPWICLCYGNDLYTESAKQVFGAVGCPPIFTDEEKTAWANYVRATVRHFAGRVTHYEIWNEPDGKWCWKHGVSAEEYGRFAHDTAKAIREVSDDAFIIGGSVCMIWDLSYMDTALSAGMAGSVDAVTFHEYTADETALYTHVPALEALIHLHDPKIRLIQGESGSQSRSDGCGALAGGAWTPERQAKQCLRHAVADLSTDVLFS
ncbi:MAG: beta-galactosidase, partial [Candidatus Flemingibacterium sp.]|nr:beta-galactosidase [Candidatus Flemingibacterium sp.]